MSRDELVIRWRDEDPRLTPHQRERAARAFVKQELRALGFKLAEPLSAVVMRRTRYGRPITRERGIRCWARRGDGAVLRGVLCYRSADPGWFRFVRAGDDMRGNGGRGSVRAAIVAATGGAR